MARTNEQQKPQQQESQGSLPPVVRSHDVFDPNDLTNYIREPGDRMNYIREPIAAEIPYRL